MLKDLPFPDNFKIYHNCRLSPQICRWQWWDMDQRANGNTTRYKEKILAIADVFEALTSPERPYKSKYSK